MGIRHFSYTEPVPLNIDISKFLISKRVLLAIVAADLNISEEELGTEDGDMLENRYGLMYFINSVFYNKQGIPDKYRSDEGDVLGVEFGRSRHEIVIKGKNTHQQLLMTFVMPDSQVHVLMVDLKFV